jgi:WD40 repeat protein
LGKDAVLQDAGPRPADALSADGKLLVQSGGGAVRVIDLTNSVGHDVGTRGDAVFAVALSSDTRLVAAGGRGGVAVVWDWETGEERGRAPVGGWVWDVAFSPDGARLAIAATDGILRVLDLSSGQLHELRGHVGMVESVSFSPDGRRVLSGGTDGTARLWDLSSGVGLIVRRETTGLSGAKYSADGSFLDVRADPKVRIGDARVLPPLEPDPAKIAPWLEHVTSAVVDDWGRLRSNP